MQLLKQTSFIILFLLAQRLAFSQFAPPAEQAGSTAIHSDSTIFIAWANTCVVERGWMNIAIADSGRVSFGADSAAVGMADVSVVSLGDGGHATLTFEVPIANGEGFDFAVFENAFLDNFLELAFVEVSSDGENYFRFEATSLTQADEQIETFGLLDATKINNLAGKYRATFGTPFDLEELENTAGLDVDNIVSIRIVDVVGSIENDFATFDAANNKINDPWPTPFPSGGFDLDAVGVINNQKNTAIDEHIDTYLLAIFPNPASDFITIWSEVLLEEIHITDTQGSLILKVSKPGFSFSFNISSLPKGMLLVSCMTEKGFVSRKVIIN
jgi:hypothetical protein